MIWKVLLFMGLIAGVGSSHAATFTVDSIVDWPDLNPGDGVCNFLAMPGPNRCTLRAAIMEANALAGPDQIVLLPNRVYPITIPDAGPDQGASGSFRITSDLNIYFLGSGAERPVVDANGTASAFDVISGNVGMFGFDITGGDATTSVGRVGGAIYIADTAGTVDLLFMRMYRNRANTGGAILNYGPDTTLAGSELYDNEHVDYFASPHFGSAIQNYGTLTIDSTAIHSNRNSDGSSGAAIAMRFQHARTTIINSTIAQNQGTGIHVLSGDRLELRNSTIAGNEGFGITITDNNVVLRMRNTVVARNLLDCDFAGTTVREIDAYNLDSDESCTLAAGSGNQPGVSDLLLAPLSRRFAPTAFATPAVWPLKAGGAGGLIDMGHPVVALNGCTASDQHLRDRPVDGNNDGVARCDIGAVELGDDVLFFDPFDRL